MNMLNLLLKAAKEGIKMFFKPSLQSLIILFDKLLAFNFKGLLAVSAISP